MAIAFGAIGAKFTQTVGATPTAIAYPATVGAGDMLVAARASWNTVGASLAAESGWTQCAQLFGGNAGGAVDNHRTTVGADVKEAAGGETGTVSFDIAGTVDGAAGVMARYTKGATETWGTVQSVTGDDATHAADRSITASSTLDLIPGDMVVVSVATGTDTSLTITSPAITAAGITFGTTNRRTSGAGSTAGQDGNVELFDALVTSGSGTVTPALAFTTATSQSGPATFVRLRVNFTGTSTISGTGAITSAGQVGTSSDVTISGTGAITSTGSVAGGGVSSGSSISGTGSTTSTGQVGTATGSSISGTGATTSAGSVGTSSDSTIAGTGATTSAGQVGKATGSSISGTGSVTSTGQIGTSSSATIAGTGSITSAGSVGGASPSSGATIGGTGSTTTTGQVGTGSGASIAGIGATTSAGQVGKATGSTLGGTGAITSGATVGNASAVTIAGVGTIASAGRVGKASGLSIAGVGAITTAGSVGGSTPTPNVLNPRAKLGMVQASAEVTVTQRRAEVAMDHEATIMPNQARARVD